MTAHSEYAPGAITAAEDFLTETGDTGVRLGGGEIREDVRSNMDGATARRLVFDSRDNAVGVLVLIVRGNTLYQALYVGPRGTETSSDVRRFVSSFALVEH